MAGFFGLFNYEKEGPGIEKNAPKKKTFVVFFETFFRNFWKFITINLVFGIMCIPGITSGLAAAGITNVTRNIARDKHSFGLSDYFETIKKNWKQALLAGIFNTFITIVLAVDVYTFSNTKGWFGIIGQGVSLCVTFIFLIMNFYIWTLMITFKFNLKQIYLNSFRFVFINMKMNLLCGGILLLVNIGLAALVFFSLRIPAVFILLLVLIFCSYPAFRFLLIQFCVFPAIKKYIIDPYYEEHPDEDIEQRKNLGIEIPEDETEEETDEDGEESDSENEEEDPDSPVFED